MQKESKGVLSKIRWRRVILDEAHVVRNHETATSRAVCSVHGRRRWAVTGTPLHNKDTDLFALLKFLRCTMCDNHTGLVKSLKKEKSRLEKRLAREAQDAREGVGRTQAARRRVRRRILRRRNGRCPLPRVMTPHFL